MSAFQQLQRDPQDQQAFDAWYRETYPALLLSAFRMTYGDRALAEDLCHDAILAFIVRGGLRKVANAGEALAYIRKSIAHAHIDTLRRAGKETTVDVLPEIAGERGVLDMLAARDEYRHLLDRLSADDQELLGMMLAGISLSEMAGALAISYSNAGVRVHRMRKLIKGLSL